MHGHHFDAVRLAAAEDVGALAEQIFELDVPVEPPAAQEEYMQAVDAFEAAERRLDSADRPENLETISALVAEGRYRMAAVRAIREGRAVPRRFPPCFFDFRHGPAVELIVWSPIGGDPRTVPVCARDADLVERDLQPKPRQLVVDHREIPFWDAPAEFGPWFRGAYEPGDVCRAATLLDGLILGARLGETG
jgi:hypothetical protein